MSSVSNHRRKIRNLWKKNRTKKNRAAPPTGSTGKLMQETVHRRRGKDERRIFVVYLRLTASNSRKMLPVALADNLHGD